MAFVTTDVYINGIKMPPFTAGGYALIPHKLWGSNAGRSNCTGDFVGDIVAIKWELQMTWENISDEDFETIDNALNTMNPFLTVKFCPKKSKGYITKKFYADDPNYPILKCVKGKTRYGTVTANLVEQ